MKEMINESKSSHWVSPGLLTLCAHAREGYGSDFVSRSIILLFCRSVILLFSCSVVQHGISTMANFYPVLRHMVECDSLNYYLVECYNILIASF